MAIYGRDFYGRTKYGSSEMLVSMAVDPFEVKSFGFDTAVLTWSEPGGPWSGFKILHSLNGYPTTVDDGEVIFDVPIGYAGNTGGSLVDSPRAGGWHYYGVFLWDSGAAVWERAAVADVLVPFDYSSTDKMWDSLPDYYRQIVDNTADFNQQKFRVNPAIYMDRNGIEPNLQLSRFLHIFGWAFDTLRSQAEHVLDGYNIDALHVNRLALLAEQFGSQLEESVPANVNRTMIRNLGYLYRRRGTVDGIREMLSLITGWEVDVSPGKNLMLSEDQANFVNPEPQLWDHTVRYSGPSEGYAGDRVRYNNNLFQAIKDSYGPNQGPPLTRTNNEWWDANRFAEPEPYTSPAVTRSDTGDISTWQIQGPNGFVAGTTFIGSGSPDPEDGTINYTNALALRNETGVTGDFVLRSIPRPATDLTVWNKRLVIESGVPMPRPRKQWDPSKQYRAGDLVMFQGAPYAALGTTTAEPSNTGAWEKLGHDDRVRLCLSWWAHGPWNTSASNVQNAVISEFDENGDLVKDTVCTPATTTGLFYDAFNDIGTLSSARTAAKGGAWGANGLGTWGMNRDDAGGYVYPPGVGAGRSYQLAPAMGASVNIAVTYRRVPTDSNRRLGLVFRWSDANNFWIATQTGVYKVVNGAAPANPASGALTYASFVAGDRLRVSLSGNTITVYKNGTQVGTATDSFNSTATRHGVEAEAYV